MRWRRTCRAAIVAYAAIVVLAAWRHEILPTPLEVPAQWSRTMLGWFGVPGGVAVFTTDAGFSPDEKITVQCFEVRAIDADGGVHRLHPDRVCPTPEPRLWVRGEDIALYRFATGMRSAAASLRSSDRKQLPASYPKLLADSIAEHFRNRADAEELSAEHFAMLWTESRTDYATGAESDRTVALMRWQSDREHGAFVSWRPDANTLARHWPRVDEP